MSLKHGPNEKLAVLKRTSKNHLAKPYIGYAEREETPGRCCVRRIMLCWLTPLMLPAADTTFSNVRMMVPEGKKMRERQVDLVFSDLQSLVVRRKGASLAMIPFSSIQKLDYEYAKRRRVGEGASMMALSPQQAPLSWSPRRPVTGWG